MRGVFSNANDVYLILTIFPPHEPPLKASSSPVSRIRMWSIVLLLVVTHGRPFIGGAWWTGGGK